MVKNTDITDDQMIGMFLENGFDEDEIAKSLHEMEDKSFAGVEKYIKDKVEAKEKKIRDHREKSNERMKKSFEKMKNEAAEKEDRLKRIKDKISNNQKDLRSKEKPVEDVVEENYTSCYFVANIFDGKNNNSFLVPLDENSSVEQLYSEIKNKIGDMNFKLYKFATTDLIEESGKLIREEFKYGRVMLEVRYEK